MRKRDRNLFSIVLLLFIFLLVCVKTGIIQNIDNYVYDIIKNWQSEGVTKVFQIITNLGGMATLSVISFVTIIILFLCHKRKYGISIVFNLMISSLTYLLLKGIIQRPRPPVEERLIEENGYSFPSGHSANNMAFYALAIYFIYENVKNKKLRNVICILLGIMPILIGFSRVYLRVHYMSDILAGFCLGIMCVILFMSLMDTKIK